MITQVEKQKMSTDTTNPYESMIRRFDVAAKIMKLDNDTYNILKTPHRQYLADLFVERPEVIERQRLDIDLFHRHSPQPFIWDLDPV